MALTKDEADFVADCSGRCKWIDPGPVRSPMKTHGGKYYLARRIIGLLPRNETYAELYGGGANVLLNLESGQFKQRIYTDLNRNKVEILQNIRDFPVELQTKLATIQYNDRTFREANTGWLDWLIRNRMSRGGQGKDFAWSERERGGQPGDVSGWATFVNSLPIINRQLTGVEILHEQALTLLRIAKASWTVYLDPPYMTGTRATVGEYGDEEMTDRDHERLAEACLASPAKIAISGYDSPEYRDWFHGWTRHEFDLPNNSGQGKTKQRRIEVVWTSY